MIPNVQPKGQLDEQRRPICPHCQTPSHETFCWYPALNCWSCGGIMYTDDYGRSATDRALQAGLGLLADTIADEIRLERARKERSDVV